MGDARQLLEVNGRVELNIAQGVEVLDGNVQLFGEELRRVRHHRGAAGQEQPLRGRTSLLPTVELHGLIDLDVQPSHELPGNLGNGRLVRVLRFLIGSPEAHEPPDEGEGAGATRESATGGPTAMTTNCLAKAAVTGSPRN